MTNDRQKLRTAVKKMRDLAGEDLLGQTDVPLIIRLVENPKYKTSRIFKGAVSLFNHDCIHILLGRGLLTKDEAFVIGYTMGSSKKMWRWRRNLFVFICKYFYPKEYRFGEEERFVFNMGVTAGSRCSVDLSKIDFNKYLDKQLKSIRKEFQINANILKACQTVEEECLSHD